MCYLLPIKEILNLSNFHDSHWSDLSDVSSKWQEDIRVVTSLDCRVDGSEFETDDDDNDDDYDDETIKQVHLLTCPVFEWNKC